MKSSELAFVGALVFACPWFSESFQEHVDFYDGVLPHLFIADVERWAEDQFDSGPIQVAGKLDTVLAFLEHGMGVGPDIAELVSVSFLEHLPRPGEPRSGLRLLVGEKCARQLDVIG